MPHKPTIFVSSTFYDLKQIRADLSSFVNRELGYEAFLSEEFSFPVDPDVDTIENCRRRVEQDADIFVLIIGGRYGFVDSETTKSITNLEYLTARAKGIPVYAFIDKQVLTLASLWKDNKEANFSKQIDNTALFDFIDKVRSQDKIWTHGFETAQDITSTLRVQLAYLMSDGLKRSLQLKRNGLGEKLAGLSAKAFKIALEQPRAWEHLLLAQTLKDEVEKSSDIRREYRAGIAHGSSEYISPDQFGGWVQARMNELRRLVGDGNKIIGQVLPDAFGLPGQPGDAEAIIFAARQLGMIYRQHIEWAQRLIKAYAEDGYKEVIEGLSLFSDDSIAEFEQFGPKIKTEIEQALAAVDSGNSLPVQVTLTFEWRISNQEKFSDAMSKLTEQLDNNYVD